MKIGIVIFSQTGNTLCVAEKLKERFIEEGYDTDLKRIDQIDINNKDPKKINIKDMPDISIYDLLIFASPVQAFTLAAVFKEYLQKLNSIEGKNVLCYVTKGLPTHGFGGNKSISIMEKIIKSKGAAIKKSDIICWKKEEERNMQISTLIDTFSTFIKSLK